MSRDDYYRRKGLLSVTVDTLEDMLKVLESYKILISNKTEGYVKAIATQEPPFPHTQFYLKKWFRTFLGIKDEAMLLINGELIRGYHREVHEKYLHLREQEQHYYNSSAELLGLSSCCVDGMNYEIRLIEKQYKKLMRGDEGDSINHLGDRVRNVEIRVDDLCKYVDSFASTIQKEMRTRVKHVQAISIEIKHKSEILSVQFKRHLTTSTDFTFTCQDARKSARKEALYSGIEEPKNTVSLQNQLTTHTHTTSGKFRSKMIVTDAEDIEYKEGVIRQRIEKQDAERRKAEQEVAKGPDFGFEFSIDREKLQAGAFDLMAVPIDPHQLSDEAVVSAAVTVAPITPACDTLITTPVSLHPAVARDPLLDVLRDSFSIKVKLVGKSTLVPHDPTLLCKTNISGTQVVAFSYIDKGQIAQLYLSVAVSSPFNFAELRDCSSSSRGFPAEELLAEVCKQLWLGMPFARREDDFSTSYLSTFLCIPVSVSVNGTKYASGDIVPLPSHKDLTEKRYLVKTDDRDASALFTSSIAKWLTTLDQVSCVDCLLLCSFGNIYRVPNFYQEEVFDATKNGLFSLLPLIHRICDCLHTRDEPLRLDGLSHLALAAAEPLPCCDRQSGAERLGTTTYLEKLLQLAEAQASSGIRVVVSESTQWCRSLSVLLPRASHVSAAAAGISAVDMADIVASVERIRDGDDNYAVVSPVRSRFSRLQSLDLQNNRLFGYVDRSWELLLCHHADTANNAEVEAGSPSEEPDSEPMDLDAPFREDARGAAAIDTQPSSDLFGRFALCVLLQSPNMQVLDLSLCADSEKQAALLCSGLAAALRAREAAGWNPLRRVGLRGLHSYPTAMRQLLARLRKSPSTAAEPEGSGLVGVIDLDTVGRSFIL